MTNASPLARALVSAGMKSRRGQSSPPRFTRQAFTIFASAAADASLIIISVEGARLHILGGSPLSRFEQCRALRCRCASRLLIEPRRRPRLGIVGHRPFLPRSRRFFARALFRFASTLGRPPRRGAKNISMPLYGFVRSASIRPPSAVSISSLSDGFHY